ncbi:hypothetical protein BHE90_014935 [Fusarium euwallaceae]|uniref:Peroxisomal trans-2-enoyl-CoA reductase n=1 Tax=Fusarium euwallaceae TaxID=1147111 RepID=A0A430L4L7_9HYPO|nr:hypothetical protein BHE90_014935 [Fusarium euwallaceae]
MRKELNKVPMGRLGRASEITEVIAFLASPMSSYMTGSTIVVDGGYTSNRDAMEVLDVMGDLDDNGKV